MCYEHWGGKCKEFQHDQNKSMYSVNLGCTLCVCTNGFAQMYSIRLSSRHSSNNLRKVRDTFIQF